MVACLYPQQSRKHFISRARVYWMHSVSRYISGRLPFELALCSEGRWARGFHSPLVRCWHTQGCSAAHTMIAVQLANERGAADIQACMQHKGAATRNLIKVDISTRRHMGYAIIAKCSASAQASAGAPCTPCTSCLLSVILALYIL